MVRSGLQQDVINLYRQGAKNAFTKSPENRSNFLLHLRYNFRHPQLRSRDYTAIEHQLRKMSRTLEMLSEPSTQRISVSREMEDWWAEEVARVRASASSQSSSPPSNTDSQPREKTASTSPSKANKAAERETPQALKREEDGRDRDQWAGTLPGHGGT